MSILVRRRCVDVEHGVVEIRVRVPSRTAPEPLISFSRTQKRDVLDEMRQSLLVFALVHGPDVHL